MLARYHKRLVTRCRHLNQAQLLCTSVERESIYPLPWPHLDSSSIKPEPLFNRLAGHFLINRLTTTFTNTKFVSSEFLKGAKEAIKTVSELINTADRDSILGNLLHPTLYKAISDSLSSLPDSNNIHLHLDKVKDMRLVSINSITGTVPDPDDRHVVAWLGQKIIASKTKLDNIVSSNNQFTVYTAKELGKEAALTKILFILSVSFKAKEKFVITETETGNIVQGVDQYKNVHHIWQFGSEVSHHESYPFHWRVYDINRYLESTNPSFYYH